jgi:hypothetical protein
MIRPDRHTNLDYSVINISSFIIEELRVFSDISYDALLQKVSDALGNQAKENYPYALNFLFLLGKLTYDQNSDSFRYNEDK